VELSRDPATGKRRQKHVSGTTRKACEAEIALVIARDGEGKPVVDSSQALSSFLEEWLDLVRPTVKPSTMRTWRSRCDAWIIPQLGHRRLRDISPADVNRLITTIIASGRSTSLANAVFSTLRTALNHAVKWELISTNPCRAVTPPRMDTEEMRTWSASEAAKAIEHSATDDRFGALWRLALTTGMRIGELIGLRWVDVDLTRGIVVVRQTISRGEQGQYIAGAPKTARGRRSIAIGPADVEALKHHRTAQVAQRLQSEKWESNDFVFCNGHGAILRSTPIDRAFARLVRDAGLPTIRIHDLRHTAATLMLENGIHPKIVSERLGHSGIQITLDRYSHVSDNMQRDAATSLEAMLATARNPANVRSS
jgi:integrase